MIVSLKMFKGARPDGDLAVPPELEAYFSVDAQVAVTVLIMELDSAIKWTKLSSFLVTQFEIEIDFQC